LALVGPDELVELDEHRIERLAWFLIDIEIDIAGQRILGCGNILVTRREVGPCVVDGDGQDLDWPIDVSHAGVSEAVLVFRDVSGQIEDGGRPVDVSPSC
jgi:hypothetical protein